MWNYFSSLSPTQLIFLCLGLGIMVYSLKDYVLGKDDDSPEPDEQEKTTLTEIVSKWEDLSNECKKANLNEAYDLLQQVFPMLVNVGDSNSRSNKK